MDRTIKHIIAYFENEKQLVEKEYAEKASKNDIVAKNTAIIEELAVKFDADVEARLGKGVSRYNLRPEQDAVFYSLQDDYFAKARPFGKEITEYEEKIKREMYADIALIENKRSDVLSSVRAERKRLVEEGEQRLSDLFSEMIAKG